MTNASSKLRRADLSGQGGITVLYLIAAMCAMSGLLYGYNLGVIAGAILFVVDRFALTDSLKDVAVSVSLLGAMVGAVVGGNLADRFGRRRIVALGAVIGLAGALLAALSTSFDLLLAGRLTAGLSIGILTCVTPLFIAELSPSHLRGRLGALFSVALTVGLLTSFFSDFAFRASEHGWRWMFAMGVAPAVLLIVISLALPESPRWLVVRGRIDQARDVLRRIVGAQRVEHDIAEIRSGLDTQTGKWSDLIKPAFKMALIAAIGLAAIRHATGAAIATFWAPELFQLAGFSSRSVELMGTVGVGVAYVVFGLTGLLLVDRLGRRPLMLFGLCGMGLMLFVLAGVFQLPSMTGLPGWIAVVAFLVFVAAFTMGPGVVVYLLISELLPLHIRALGMGLANLVLWGTYLFSTLSFPILIGLVGDSGTFITYGLLVVLSWMFVYKLVPETKGRSLEEIESYWRASAGDVAEASHQSDATVTASDQKRPRRRSGR